VRLFLPCVLLTLSLLASPVLAQQETVAVGGRNYIAAPSTSPGFAKEIITIRTAKGKLQLNTEIAESIPQLTYGLMQRTSLADDAGMLFVYPKPQNAGMWMKNTLIPLDMLFIDEKGTITHIHANAQPGSTDTITASKPSRAVLELAGGAAQRLGIAVGDSVSFRVFQP
jgi:uncharacterized protein